MPVPMVALLAGVLVGLRSLTPPAAAAWAAHLGWLRLPRLLSWIGTTPAVAIVSLLALGELAADKLPGTPNRTGAAGLSARLVLGALTGACVAAAGAHGPAGGAILGAVGGVAGCFGGYQARTRLVRALGTPDSVVAVLEDVVAIAGSIWIVSYV